MHLFEIAPAIRDAQATVEDWAAQHEGQVDDCPAWEALLNLQENREQKLLDLGCLYKELTAQAKAAKDVVAQQAERARAMQAHADRIEDLLVRFLAPGEKLADARVAFGWRKSTAVVLDEGKVAEDFPEEFRRTKTTVDVDRTALKEALAAGKTVAGAALQARQNLQIK